MGMRHIFLLVILQLSLATVAQNEWYRIPNISSSLAIRNINIMQDGGLWLGTYNNGAMKLAGSNWITYDTSNSGISDNDVREISKDSQGNFWMATWNKLSKYNPTAQTWQNYNISGVSLDILYSVEIDAQDRIWVGTDGGANPEDGLYLQNTGAFYNAANSALDSNWITFLEKDRLGKIWAGGQSIVKIDGTTLTGTTMESIGFPSTSSAMAIGFNSSNHIWVAAYGGGLGYYNGTTWTIYTPANSGLPETSLWSLTVDQNDNVWIGTENSGVVKFDGVNWTIFNTSNSPITSNRIDALNCDSLNNIWIAPTYGGLLVYNQNGPASVKGNVFYDLNSDNIRQTNEPFVKNAIVSTATGNYYGVSDSNGNYKTNILTAGSYTLSAHPERNYVANVSPSTVPLSINESFVPLVQNFAVHLQSNINDVSVIVTPHSPPRLGFSSVYSVTVTNLGTTNAANTAVQFHADNILTIDAVTGNPSITNNLINWTIPSLGIDESITFEVTASVPNDILLMGTYITTSASCTLSNDVDLSNNSITLPEIVVSSFDPNEKDVLPNGVGPAGNIPLDTQQLDYTVHFQNTGTYEAWRVIVSDEISPNLDLNTLKTVASSDAYTVAISRDRKVTWTFNSINLPYASQDELGSQGFVRFTIKPKQGAVYGDVITNKANIYFDYNPPIITNQTTNTFFDFSLGLDELNKKHLVVYPNPANEKFSIKAEQEMFPLTVILYDISGRVLQQNTLNENKYIDTQGLSKGLVVYKILSQGEENVGVGKLLIE
jgi:fimbrial isopeptide formation D2 family protein